MVSEEFLSKKRKLFKLLKEGRDLDRELELAIVDTYGKRGERALEVIKEGGVAKLGRRWFVRGRRREYEVVKNLCSCGDYALNITTGKAGVDYCYHVLAKIICELLDQYYIEEHEEKS